jgi:UDP-N-acetylmuramoyl-tripeptide--D-alanyl-D-alanine ligase
MPFFNPKHLEQWSGGKWNHMPSKELRGFAIDSRLIKKDELFIAIKADRDGHNFIKKAMVSGAGGALVETVDHSLEIPQLKVDDTLKGFQQIAKRHRDIFNKPVVGITGSCGKTSTKEILAKLLPAAISTAGNFNNHLGVPLTLLKIDQKKHQFAIIEAGINQAGEMSELQGMINCDIAVITMVGQSHLDGLGTVNQVAEEKIKLWTENNQDRWAIFPESCLRYPSFSNALKKTNQFQVLKNADPGSKKIGINEAYFTLSTETNEQEDSCVLKIWRHGSSLLSIVIPRVSTGMASNLALAALVASKLGVTDDEICERLPQYSPSTLRGNRLQGRGCEYFVDCYNANPSSMEDSVQFFQRESKGKKKMLVLGGMEELGNDARKLHHITGSRIVLESQDMVALVGEKASWLASGLIDSGARKEQVLVLNDLEDARPLLEDFHGNVLLKGSRSNHLENLIPSWATEPLEKKENAKC